jgi:4-amino-4-deoxy-L-arabinose transferase-like glycosyltransferase
MWAFSMIKAGLWLAAGLVSALLVYWLHFKPVYDEDWTSAAGSVVCAGLSIWAVIGCLNNLGAAFSGPDKSSQRPLQR